MACSVIRYVRALLMVVVSGKLRWLALAGVQLALLLPMLMGYPSGSFVFGDSEIQAKVDLLEGQLSSGVYDTAPEDLAAGVELELKSLISALQSGQNSSERYGGLADYYEHGLSDPYTSLDADMKNVYAARALLLRRVSELESPCVFESADRMPALYYLAFLPYVAPFPLVCLLALAISSGVLDAAMGGRLISRAPVGPVRRWLATWGSLLFCTACVLLLAVAPAFAIALARTGLGAPDYPAVSIIGGTVCETTVSALIVRQAALALTSVAWLCALAACVAALCSDARIGFTAAALMIAVSCLPTYLDKGAPWHDVGRSIPLTYLQLTQVLGAPLYANGVEMQAFAGATFERGISVSLASLSMLLLVLVGVSLLVARRHAKRLERGLRHIEG